MDNVPTDNLPHPGDLRPIHQRLDDLHRALVNFRAEGADIAATKKRALDAIDGAVKRLELIRADVEDVQ